MGKITGKNAYIYLAKTGQTLKDAADTWALSDWSISLSKGVVEQELVAKPGNYYTAGALSVEGSFTNCRFAASGNYDMIESIVESSLLEISGGVNANDVASLRWHFHSAQVTSYDVTFGDASTISEASIDWTILNPKDVWYSNPQIRD